MEGSASTKRRVPELLLLPLLAAGASVAASYVVKKGPAFVEDTLLPRLRDASQGAGGVAEKLPQQARSAVSSGGELAEQLTDKARDVVGGDTGTSSAGSSRRLSQDEVSRRSDERAKHRAQRRRKARR
jgi:hypothetical protein